MATININDIPNGGTGLLAIFCDLNEEDQADFRPWLTEDMFPARIAIGFNTCASFDRIKGDGPEFLTLYEMPSLGHLYGEPYQALRQTRTPRDAAYHQKFQNPERYTLSLVGPELSDQPGGFEKYIYVDRFDLQPSEIQEFNMWFISDYLPALANITGLARVRRYLSMEGTPRDVILHEFENEDSIEKEVWQKLRSNLNFATSALYQCVVKAS